MPWCPKCGTEYRNEFDICADCRETLIEEQPVLPEIIPSRFSYIITKAYSCLRPLFWLFYFIGLFILWLMILMSIFSVIASCLHMGYIEGIHNAMQFVIPMACCALAGFTLGFTVGEFTTTRQAVNAFFFLCVPLTVFLVLLLWINRPIQDDWIDIFNAWVVFCLLIPAVIVISVLWGTKLAKEKRASYLALILTLVAVLLAEPWIIYLLYAKLNQYLL